MSVLEQARQDEIDLLNAVFAMMRLYRNARSVRIVLEESFARLEALEQNAARR